MSEWKPTACILCELNCGIEVKVGDNRTIEKVRGDKKHPGSKGYLCNKASRLNYYQNGRDRISSPLRRRKDGTFEAIDWDTAIREISEKLSSVKNRFGGDKILYIGGGGQGNHAVNLYSRATQKALGIIYKTNAVAQEKTGEIWVNEKMMGMGPLRGDFENCEVGIFLGKNPWQSHGFHQTRKVLQRMAKDPAKTIIVFDPRRSETAAIADYHLAVKPGTDAWLLAAMIAVIVQEDWVDHEWVKQHTEGFNTIYPWFTRINIGEYCDFSGVDEETVRAVVKILRNAKGVAVWEDLGVQMNIHSTLVSYLNKLLTMITGNFGKKGSNYIPLTVFPVTGPAVKGVHETPVTNAKIIAGVIPCNSVSEEILTDHPERQRAVWVDSSNPVHSYANSHQMAAAMRATELTVVVDIAMTETAVLADYVLPAATQFEKA